MHYLRWYKTGSLDQKRGGTVQEKYARKVVKHPGNKCWEWTGQVDDKMGYGRLYTEGYGSPRLFAHRVSYELHIGLIPDGMFVLHKCDNPECTNPKHLFLGTIADNIADMDRKGRGNRLGQKGEAHLKAKLTEAQVREIRASSLPHTELAKLYGVTPTAIRSARIGKNWKHLE